MLGGGWVETAFERTTGGHGSEPPLGHEFGQVGHVLQQGQFAVPGIGIAMGDHHKRHHFRTKRVEQSGVVGSSYDVHGSGETDFLEHFQQQVRTRRVKTVVDFLDHQLGLFRQG